VVGGKQLLDRILFTLQLSENIKTFPLSVAHIFISENLKPNEAVGLNFVLVSHVKILANFPVILKPFAKRWQQSPLTFCGLEANQ